MDPSSNQPAPSATAARRSSRLQAKQAPGGPPAPCSSAHVETTPVADKQPHGSAHDSTTSTSEEDVAAKQLEAAEIMLFLAAMGQNYPRVGNLPAPPASVNPTSTSSVARQQPKTTVSEKENRPDTISKNAISATRVAMNSTTTIPSNSQPPKPKKGTKAITGKRSISRVLKRKADDNAQDINSPTSNVEQLETRTFKRPRRKFVAEPSERISRNSRAKVQVEGAGQETVLAQEHEYGVGFTEQATATASAPDNRIEFQKVSDNDAPTTSESSVQRQRLALTIPARAHSNTEHGAATAVEPPPTVESAVTATEPEIANDSEGRSAAPQVRLPGGKHIKPAA